MLPHHTRYIVCAAIRRGHTIICGPRHANCLNQANGLNMLQPNTWEMGFVDQDNVFMDRKEAWKVADAAGQIRNLNGYMHDCNTDNFPPGKATKLVEKMQVWYRNNEGELQLFSEHLY